MDMMCNHWINFNRVFVQVQNTANLWGPDDEEDVVMCEVRKHARRKIVNLVMKMRSEDE